MRGRLDLHIKQVRHMAQETNMKILRSVEQTGNAPNSGLHFRSPDLLARPHLQANCYLIRPSVIRKSCREKQLS